MPDDRGYVVVRPDGTVMWETAAREEGTAWDRAFWKLEMVRVHHWDPGPVPQDLIDKGYTLRRCRVEGEHGQETGS